MDGREVFSSNEMLPWSHFQRKVMLLEGRMNQEASRRNAEGNDAGQVGERDEGTKVKKEEGEDRVGGKRKGLAGRPGQSF